MIEIKSDSLNEELKHEGIYVMKFGGTSVGNAQAIEKTGRIIANERAEVGDIVVVVSAIRGVTDSLVRVCNYLESDKPQDVELELEDITSKHNLVIGDLELSRPYKDSLEDHLKFYFDTLANTCRTTRFTPEVKDLITGLGERINCHIVASALNYQGIKSEAVDATEIIETDNNFGNANPDIEKTEIYSKRKVLSLLAKGVVPIVTGFVGATKDYRPTTLGRGGSDYTASILGRVLDAKEVWIWTDVDGVYSTDPAKDPNARIIPHLTYEEADIMARNGARVLYEKTVEPLMDTKIVLRVKNTFNPEFIGTEISGEIH
ncbi:MAG: hypothetical protein ACD_30C00112G0010 [uncultured bacterium]|uniref:Aspartokinase n=4 Tax=Microgenomates group TaxID=1794810 RepID=A0A1F5K5K5_9BACT|nr:MAG: hypothetical protein ACD_30C00112G0010 [uncultured bacterium]KKQ14748.1 MAG: Aspartokinase [Candidatus Daviesbacteria bacterium GW2011_GWA1_36_8]KKQ74899.1 MAG: Aspartokinase [Candidatus Woesebacteria bacterium GW2011_GWB1_38_5b]OGE17170.1 MAG: hypothetical protein A2858_00505 [Candidatus Daviesbacteria bacterium RIFCSPHIGHO2_01_FULL_36_37]OGE35951.1 MAG: hypothetical protein A3E66_01500 [Candidatus Daviesbacteria bacterium RIFCSPHIGHO2_12_FULL_37_16]